MPGSKGCTAPVKILFGCYFWFVQWPGEVGGHRLDVWLLLSESVKNTWFFFSFPSRPCGTWSCLLPHLVSGCRDTDEKRSKCVTHSFIHSFIHSCTQIKCCKCLISWNPQQIPGADDHLSFRLFASCTYVVIFVGKTKKDLKKVWRVFIATRSAVRCLTVFTSGHKHTKTQIEGLLKVFLILQIILWPFSSHPGPTGWFKPTS